MASSSSTTRSLVCAAKRLRVRAQHLPMTCQERVTNVSQITPPYTQPSRQPTRHLQTQALPENVAAELSQLRLPRSVQATYLAPLKRQATHRIPTCDLQLRSYSVRNLEVFADFALRAAYYLHLPASGPIPLPRMTELWTVPRSNFIFKKSQENFRRITLRRLIQIQDGHPDVVKIWLDFLQKHHYYGVGMKANVWDYSGLDVTKELDSAAEQLESSGEMAEKMNLLVARKEIARNAELMEKRLFTEPFKGQWGAYAAMSANSTVPPATERIDKEKVGGSGTADSSGRRRGATATQEEQP